MDTDTDTLLALVSSLTNEEHQTEFILEALVQSNGDPEFASKILNNSNHNNKRKTEKKRKRPVSGGLEDWLSKGSGSSSSKHAKTQSNPAPAPPKSPSKASTSNTKPVASLLSILKQPPPSKKLIPKKPPLTLSNPTMIAEHTTCTMHLSALPPELASALFYSLEESSREWKRNKWWLFDRLVESPHRTSFFVRKTDGISDDETWHESATYWYNGRITDPPEIFSPEMEQACQIVERIVSSELRKRSSSRYALEWAGGDTGSADDLLWRANVAASNRYEGRNDSVGWHSDHLTYLGPYCTIASLSLGTRRTFSLREVVPVHEAETRSAQTFNIPLPHNSLIIMHASTQEHFKHSIPPQSAMDMYRPSHPRHPGGPIAEPSNCRMNVTFRFYRPDFRPESIPRCGCGIPMVLRADMKMRLNRNTNANAAGNNENTNGNADVIDTGGSGDGEKRKDKGKATDSDKEQKDTNANSAEKEGAQNLKYWWTCFAGSQNDGKSCNMWQVMDMEAERRGPTIQSMQQQQSSELG